MSDVRNFVDQMATEPLVARPLHPVLVAPEPYRALCNALRGASDTLVAAMWLSNTYDQWLAMVCELHNCPVPEPPTELRFTLHLPPMAQWRGVIVPDDIFRFQPRHQDPASAGPLLQHKLQEAHASRDLSRAALLRSVEQYTRDARLLVEATALAPVREHMATQLRTLLKFLRWAPRCAQFQLPLAALTRVAVQYQAGADALAVLERNAADPHVTAAGQIDWDRYLHDDTVQYVNSVCRVWHWMQKIQRYRSTAAAAPVDPSLDSEALHRYVTDEFQGLLNDALTRHRAILAGQGWSCLAQLNTVLSTLPFWNDTLQRIRHTMDSRWKPQASRLVSQAVIDTARLPLPVEDSVYTVFLRWWLEAAGELPRCGQPTSTEITAATPQIPKRHCLWMEWTPFVVCCATAWLRSRTLLQERYGPVPLIPQLGVYEPYFEAPAEIRAVALRNLDPRLYRQNVRHPPKRRAVYRAGLDRVPYALMLGAVASAVPIGASVETTASPPTDERRP